MAATHEVHRALIVLNPAESKRLIAQAVAQLDEVQHALHHGRLIIGNGTTNAYVAEELTGQPVSKWRFAAGVIAHGRLEVTPGDTRLQPIALDHGKVFEEGWVALLQQFGRDDVFIKGGNALDPEGNVGVLLASAAGGTVGQLFGIFAARGAHLVAPIGLEKLIPDVTEAAWHSGIATTDRADGFPVGMALLPSPRVVTEIEAFENLCGVAAWHIASGGVSGSEGSVTLAVEGSQADVNRAFELAASLNGEAPVGPE